MICSIFEWTSTVVTILSVCIFHLQLQCHSVVEGGGIDHLTKERNERQGFFEIPYINTHAYVSFFGVFHVLIYE